MTFPKHSFLLFWCQLWLHSWSWSCRLWELQSYSWGDRREMSLSDHSPTFFSSCRSSRGHREGPGIDDSLQLFCADITGEPSPSANTSRKSTIQPYSRSNLENLQYWLRKTWSESGKNSPPKEVAVGQGRQKNTESNRKTVSVLW